MEIPAAKKRYIIALFVAGCVLGLLYAYKAAMFAWVSDLIEEGAPIASPVRSLLDAARFISNGWWPLVILVTAVSLYAARLSGKYPSTMGTAVVYVAWLAPGGFGLVAVYVVIAVVSQEVIERIEKASPMPPALGVLGGIAPLLYDWWWAVVSLVFLGCLVAATFSQSKRKDVTTARNRRQ